MRITKRVFTDLAIWMMGFGMIVGIIFPFFMVVLGMERTIAYSWWFFIVCILAGLFVGAVNIVLAKNIVGGRLLLLSTHMGKIEDKLKEVAGSHELVDCSVDECHLPVDSEDAIGKSSRSFNSLVDTLSSSLRLEMEIRSYSRMLTTHLEAKTLCYHALLRLLETFNLNGGAILVETGGTLQLFSSMGLDKAETLAKNTQVLEVLRNLKPKKFDIPSDVVIDGILATFRPSIVFAHPIVYKQVPLGVTILASSQRLSPSDAVNLDLFVSNLALALHNALTYDQMERLAAVDPLTGIYNRRFGMTRLREEYVRAVKQNGTLGILMLDIDRFKQVNDTYGHMVGDRVLQAIASSARNQLREGDLLVRLGGDEFMVVLLGANKKDLAEIGETIRRQISEKRISYGQQDINVTVSIGGASFPEFDAKDEEDLIEAADRALYEVKESGRNRVGL